MKSVLYEGLGARWTCGLRAGRVAVGGDLKVLRAHGVRCGLISDERRPSRRSLIACLRSTLHTESILVC
jgi:hypothetical protein